jgi:hypothetical protein
MTEIRLCRDCRWSNKPGSDNEQVACNHPTSRHPVGNRPKLYVPKWRRLSCGSARWAGYPGDGCCGPEGKYWEPIEVTRRKGRDRRVSGVEPNAVNELTS